jgi:hypothetical protein
MSDPSLEQILAVFDERPPAAHQVELSERGVVIHRMLLSQKDYRSIERLLSNRPLWVFDFSISPADLADNVHNGTELNPTYCGVIGPRGAPIFRVDHHYDVAALARESTTPLVRRWLLGLHEARLSAVLSTVSKGRYFANHWDVDIMLSHHLASMALDQAYLKTVGAWLADAALHND